MGSSLILFTDTVNGNAYATVADIELLMPANPQWLSLDGRRDEDDKDPESFKVRDSLILAATNIIDTVLQFRGDKLTETQSLEFPREFLVDGDSSDERFSEAGQVKQLRAAVFYQVQAYLREMPVGNVDYREGSGPLMPQANIDMKAYNILSFYMRSKFYVH